jgi:small subunit ribosomal protein S7
MSLLRQVARRGPLSQYGWTRTLTTIGSDTGVQAEARCFLLGPSSSQQVSSQQVVPPVPVQAAFPSLDDMHHHLPPDKNPILHLFATYIMSKKVRSKPKDTNEPYNKPFAGKYARAAKITSQMLLFIQSSTRSPPMPIVQQAILDVSPAVKCLRQKHGAKVIVKPTALNERQRIGKGIEWILEACRYRPAITFPERLAQEILGVLHGNSGALKKKWAQHEFATVNRFVVGLCGLSIPAHTGYQRYTTQAVVSMV